MKIKEGFVLRNICREYIISAEGAHQVDFSKLISLNGTAAFLLKELWDKDFTPETMADMLCEEFEVSHEVALSDSQKLCNQLVENGVAE